MKPLIAKVLLVLPVLVFVDWIIMVVIGCVSNMCGAGTLFFCSIYCYIGISLLSISLLLLLFIAFKHFSRHRLDFLFK